MIITSVLTMDAEGIAVFQQIYLMNSLFKTINYLSQGKERLLGLNTTSKNNTDQLYDGQWTNKNYFGSYYGRRGKIKRFIW